MYSKLCELCSKTITQFILSLGVIVVNSCPSKYKTNFLLGLCLEIQFICDNYNLQSLTIATEVRKLIWNANQTKNSYDWNLQSLCNNPVLHTSHFPNPVWLYFKIYTFTTSGNFVTRSLRNRKPGNHAVCVSVSVSETNEHPITSSESKYSKDL